MNNNIILSNNIPNFQVPESRLQYLEKDFKKIAKEKIYSLKDFDLYNINTINREIYSIPDQSKDVMKKIFTWYETRSKEEDFDSKDIIFLISLLERVHPYIDLNCRTFCVLLLNKELIRNKYTPVLMEESEIFDYADLNELSIAVNFGQINFLELYYTDISNLQ